MKTVLNFKKITNAFLICVIIFFMLILLIFPKATAKGAFWGLAVSGKVLIPALFPFMTCVLFIINSDILRFPKSAEKLFIRAFGMNADTLLCFMLSFIGGYPVGARLLNGLAQNKKISPHNATLFLNCFVSAGPAFIISAIGQGVLGSKRAGVILLASHIFASLFIAILCSFFADRNTLVTKNIKQRQSMSDCFIFSVKSASEAVVNICAFVIFFSAVNSGISHLSQNTRALEKITYFTEVTSGCAKTNNIYFISFLLGFSGICVWCQVFSSAKHIKKNILIFASLRIAHGAISMVSTYMLLKIFPCSVEAISNGLVGTNKTFYSNLTLSLSMIMMIILLIISLQNKNFTGKILDDML